MCATSLTSLKASLVKDGTLAINEYRSDEFKLQLNRPLSKDEKESRDLMNQYSSRPICESYPERKKYMSERAAIRRREEKKKAMTNDAS
jgi:predicted ATP-binding protein involved in virulence